MSCFTFEFGTPDSHFYHIPEGSVSHVRILSRGTTGDIYFKTSEVLHDVPRDICEDLVEWLNEQNAFSIQTPWIGIDPSKKPSLKPRVRTKPIGWEGTFGEAVKAMKEGWKVKRASWSSGHLLLIDNSIRTQEGIAWALHETAILATDWELVD